MLGKLMEKLGVKSTKLMAALVAAAVVMLVAAIVMFLSQRHDPFNIIEAYATNNTSALPQTCETEPTQNLTIAEQEWVLVVHISGEVVSPGVFELSQGARVWDAVIAAGGLTPYADQNAINLARLLSDEDHIIVFSIKDNMPPAVSGNAAQNQVADNRININTATNQELQALSGVGPVIAGNIISHREARGGFATIEEIMNVSGIGERIFDNIRDRIRVD